MHGAALTCCVMYDYGMNTRYEYIIYRTPLQMRNVAIVDSKVVMTSENTEEEM